VRAHLGPARWTGIAIGALVLLFWPAPTLSVLIWIAALVALYLGALEWLQNRAGEPAAGPMPARVDGVAAPVSPAAVVPTSRGATDGVAVGSPIPPAATAVGTPPNAVPEPRAPEPLAPAALTPEAISALGGRLDLLVRLGAARDSGVLTDDEFRHEKERLLAV
jgi:hypothetical protein